VQGLLPMRVRTYQLLEEGETATTCYPQQARRRKLGTRSGARRAVLDDTTPGAESYC
jgi:hypothetical protein